MCGACVGVLFVDVCEGGIKGTKKSDEKFFYTLLGRSNVCIRTC